jgi:uncharacterized membrane protein YozB (DUF420 family)
MSKKYLRENATLIAIILFIIIFISIIIIKPNCFYNKNGSLRVFGIGYKNKTIFPLWILSIILGILCYLIVIYYNTYF